MRPESYREQKPEKRCGNCRYIALKEYVAATIPYCCKGDKCYEFGSAFLAVVNKDFGICDHWEAREE